MPLKKRLFYLLLASLPCILVYSLAGLMKSPTWIIPETRIDQLIPFNPHGIWLYLFFYVYISFTFLTVKAFQIKRTSFVFLFTAISSGILFICFPTRVIFPDFEVNGTSAALLNFISENDTERNCFPSMHASLITICTLANWDKTHQRRSFVFLLLTLLMYYSIIAVRRHVFIDLAAGILIALVVWHLFWIYWNRIRKERRNCCEE